MSEDSKMVTTEMKGGHSKMATRRGSAGRGDKGACGGTRKRNGDGGGIGNRGTGRQPKKRK